MNLNDPEWPFYVKFRLFCPFKFKIFLFTYTDSVIMSTVRPQRNHLHLCLLEVCNVFQQKQQGCGLDGISIEAEVKAGPFRRGRGRIEADLLALQQATSFHFRSFIFVSSLAEDKEILSS